MIELREDQLETVSALRRALAEHQSVLLRAPCGYGKTVVAAYMAHGATQKHRRVTFGCHRRELIRQTANTFDKFGIRYGIIAAGMRSDPFAHVQIASHGTLMNQPGRWKCDLFVPDEAHLWGQDIRADRGEKGPSRSEMIAEIRKIGAHIVPLTATPERGNGGGLAHIADYMIQSRGEGWLIENGHLAKYKAYAPVTANLSGLHTQQGDYIVSELEERFSKPQVIGDSIAAWLKFANGKRTIGYCYSRKSGEETAAAFRAAGISAVFIDGETPDDVRIAAIKEFAHRRIKILFNCALLREGFDVSSQVGFEVPIEAVLLRAPTKSLPLAIQMMMRTMRRQPGHAVIIDMVNLLAMHGLPDDDREWSLEGVPRKKREAEAAIATMKCPTCAGTFRPTQFKNVFRDGMACRACPECEAVFPVGEGRVVEEVAGEIDEVDVEAMRREKKAEVARAWDLPSLVKVAKVRGNKPGWVLNVMKARGKSCEYRDVMRVWNG